MSEFISEALLWIAASSVQLTALRCHTQASDHPQNNYWRSNALVAQHTHMCAVKRQMRKGVEWKAEKTNWERKRGWKKKTDAHSLIYSTIYNSLPCLSVKHCCILGLHNSSGVTASRGLENPAPQQSCHSRGSILPQGELQPAVSAPWNGWWQQHETWGKIQKTIHIVHCAGHAHKDRYIIYKCVLYTQINLS